MYSLRPATDDDFEFMYELHEVTLRVHVDAIWGCEEAFQEAARLPAGLRVFKINVGARRLYQRLGFAIVGENETHYDMRCG